MCGLKDRAESKVIPRQRTCGTGESVEPLTVIDRSVKGVEREGGKMMISVLSMLSLRKREEKKEEYYNITLLITCGFEHKSR